MHVSVHSPSGLRGTSNPAEGRKPPQDPALALMSLVLSEKAEFGRCYGLKSECAFAGEDQLESDMLSALTKWQQQKRSLNQRE